jgi:transporter family-2 protein
MFSNVFTWIAIAAAGGIAVTLQAQFMGVMDKQLGTLESVFITYGSGGLIVGLAMLAARGGNLSAWRDVPVYTFAAGIFGLIIVGTIGFATQKIGLVPALTIVVAAQYVAGALIKQYGWLGAPVEPLNLTRWVGMGAMLLGVWLISKG